jgi:hypothetical protein
VGLGPTVAVSAAVGVADGAGVSVTAGEVWVDSLAAKGTAVVAASVGSGSAAALEQLTRKKATKNNIRVPCCECGINVFSFTNISIIKNCEL